MSSATFPAPNRFWTRFFPPLLFLAALGLRAVNLQSHQHVWVMRGQQFWQNLFAGRPGDTVFTGHPGVTVMWLAGAGGSVARWLSGDAISLQVETLASTIPLVIGVSLIVVAIYLVLLRLVDPVMAGVAALLVAFDPQHSAASSVVHPDALLSVLVPLGALTLVIAARAQDRRVAMLAGVVAGLGLLTKLPALALGPLAVLAFGVAQVARRAGQAATWRGAATEFAARLLRWTLGAAVTFVALWPAMWARPLAALSAVAEVGIVRHVFADAPRREPFFLGKAWTADPGWAYYAYTTAIQLTAVAFVFALAGLVLLAAMRRRADQRGAAWACAALLVCAVIVFAGISQTGDKTYRYGLPLLMLLDIVAGIGIVWWARALAERFAPGRARRVEWGLAAGIVAIHLGLGLARWPYFGNTGNDLFGGTLAADYVLGLGLYGEGMKEAVDYVNRLPGAPTLKVACTFQTLCREYGTFEFVKAKKFGPEVAGSDYLIYARLNVVEREYELPRGPQPLQVIELAGLPFAWVYPGAAAAQSDPSLPPVDYRAPTAASFRLTLAGGAALLLAAAGAAPALRRQSGAC